MSKEQERKRRVGSWDRERERGVNGKRSVGLNEDEASDQGPSEEVRRMRRSE